MKKIKLLRYAFFHSLGVTAYVLLVALFMKNAEKLFGQMTGIFGPAAILLLLVLSAAITGALVLGKPILFYLDKKKQEAVFLFFYTLIWLFFWLLAILFFLLIL